MTTEKQIEANRSNALKSTGPQTPEGKAKVAQNAVKHGLTAECILIADENQEDFETFRDSMAESLQPEGAVESLLAERIVTAAWRLRRTIRLERESVNKDFLKRLENWEEECEEIDEENRQLEEESVPEEEQILEDDDCDEDGDPIFEDYDAEPREKPPEPVSASIAALLMKNTDFYGKLSRYEAHIERGMFRALHELQRLQAARKNGNVSVPAAVDVHIDGLPGSE